MSIKENARELLRHGAIYFGGTVAATLIRIFLLPLFTRYIPAGDYGIISLLDTAVEIIRIFVAMGLGSAIVRFYHETAPGKAQDAVVFTGTMALTGLCLGTGLILWAGRTPITRAILGTEPMYQTYFLLCACNMLFNLVRSGPASFLMVRKRSKLLAGVDLVQLLLAAGLNVYLVVFKNMGILGMLTGNLISSGLVCIFLFAVSARGLEFIFDGPLLKRMVIYSLPLVVSLFAAAGIHNIDRFFIKHFSTLTQVGLYSLAYQFPFMLNTLFTSSFERIWGGNTLYAVAREPDARYQFKKISSYYLFLMGYLLFACSVAGKSIVTLLLAPEYREAYGFIPWIALGVWCYAFHIFLKVGVILSKKTYLMMINFALTFLINVITNFFLVSRFQAMGAAYATVITYACFSVMGYFIYRSCYEIELDWARLFLFGVCATVVYIIRSQFFLDGFGWNLMVDVAFILLFPAILWMVPGAISPSEKINIRSFTKQQLAILLNRTT